MTKKISIVLLAVFVMITSAAVVEDISFSTDWTLVSGCTMKGDTLVLTGDGKMVIKASRSIWYIPNASNIENLYFVADVYLENVVAGANVWERPRFLVMNASTNGVLAANNMDGLISNKWFFTGTKVATFNKKNATAVTVEFRVQQCQGTMKVVNPRLVDVAPEVKYSFPLNVPADRTCSIDLKSSEIRPFPQHLISSNTHFLWASGEGWKDPEVRDIIKNRFTLGNLRFPGGAIGNFYDWKTDGFYGDAISQKNTAVWTAYQNGFKFHYDDFASLCKETGATATLMFNVMQDDVPTATDRLKNRIASGIDIGWIEMGNENYYNGQNYGNVENIDEYISHTHSLATSLKGVDSNVKVAVNIDHSNYADGSWNARLMNQNYYDAAVMHPYVTAHTGLPCSYAFATMLSSYGITKHRLEEFKNHFPNTPLICSEYGVLLTDTPKNFMTTLTSIDLFLALLEGNDEGIVQQAGRHMMYHSDNNHVATCYFRDPTGTTMYRTSIGVAEEMWIQFFTGSELYSAVGKSAEITSGVPGIIARAVKRADSTQFLVVNKLPEDGTLNATLDGKALGDYSMEWFTLPIMGDTLGYALTADPLQRTTGSGNATIPAYSVSIITYRGSSNPIQKTLSDTESKFKIKHLRAGIYFSATKPAEIKVLNLAGKVVEKIVGLKTGIIGQTLPNGVYIVDSKVGESHFNDKVLIGK